MSTGLASSSLASSLPASHACAKSARVQLREWVISTSGKIRPEELHDDTPLIEQRVISSLHITDLILFLESLRESPVDLDLISGASFRDINAICATFLTEAAA